MTLVCVKFTKARTKIRNQPTYTQREGVIIKKRREYTYMGTGEKSHGPRPWTTLRPYMYILNMSAVRQTQTASEK